MKETELKEMVQAFRDEVAPVLAILQTEIELNPPKYYIQTDGKPNIFGGEIKEHPRTPTEKEERAKKELEIIKHKYTEISRGAIKF